jgi:hypothetical protein
LARRAARAADGALGEKASRRFGAGPLAAISRANARDVALTIGTDAVRWVAGAGEEEDVEQLVSCLGLPAIHAAQAGLVADLDAIADAIYGRS